MWMWRSCRIRWTSYSTLIVGIILVVKVIYRQQNSSNGKSSRLETNSAHERQRLKRCRSTGIVDTTQTYSITRGRKIGRWQSYHFDKLRSAWLTQSDGSNDWYSKSLATNAGLRCKRDGIFTVRIFHDIKRLWIGWRWSLKMHISQSRISWHSFTRADEVWKTRYSCTGVAARCIALQARIWRLASISVLYLGLNEWANRRIGQICRLHHPDMKKHSSHKVSKSNGKWLEKP